MKKKYIDGTGCDWIEKYTSKYKYLDDKHKGYISLVNVEKVKFKITVDYDSSDTCLFDDNYKCVVFMPLGKKWCVSTVFNDCNEIIEWYFDMTKENSIDENGKPYFLDLYLDIAVSPNGNIAILDEDELQQALDNGVINEYDFKLAKETCQHIMTEIIPDYEFMTIFFHKHLRDLSNQL